MAVNKNKFSTVTQLVIDKLEGGYYNPAWHSTGDSRYGSSGETMFGIDRVAGGSINTTTAGKEFWGIIDKNKTRDVWKWNYKGGTLAPKLKELVVDIMYPVYERNATTYLDPQTKAIVDNDNRLLFHFIYASWNGSGWFKKFANDMDKAVKNGVTNPDKLVQVALDSRTKEGLSSGSSPNSLIAQGGRKIAGFIESLKNVGTTATDIVKKKPLITILITMVTVISIYALIKTLNNK
jgi:hypothetical protein